MSRLLFVLPLGVPPDPDPARDRFTYLSEVAEGEVLMPVWWKRPDQAAPHLRAGFPLHRVGRFRYHLLLAYKWPRICRRPALFLSYLRCGWGLHRERKFEVIVAYGTNTPALAAIVLKWLTGAKLVVEVPGTPENAFRYDRPRPGRLAPIKRFAAGCLLRFAGGNADCIKLVYAGQLRCYPSLQRKPSAAFPNFVPITQITSVPSDERYVLCVGHPWYTKGMDILIEAFKIVAPAFPGWKLKLLGHFPDRDVLERLRGECTQIELLAACPHAQALKIIGACTVYVLASRTEGFARVLLEAMAAGKPIVASAVGGTSACITDGVNGLLVQPGDVAALAARLSELLSGPGLRERLGRRARERVLAEFDERAYVRRIAAMLAEIAPQRASSSIALDLPAVDPGGEPARPQDRP